MYCLRRVVLAFAVMTIPMPAWAQASSATPDFHWCTVSGGAGYSAVAGKDSSNLSGEWNVQAGLGFAWPGSNPERRWNLFLDFDYLFDQTSVKASALLQAKNLNPLNLALLNATGGTSRFNVVAFDPTLRVAASSRADIYVFGGFGWFRRQVALTGVSNQGSLLQPGNPSVFLRNSSSGSVDGGGGINFKPKKGWAMPYVEIRLVHGLAVNSSTTLAAYAAGIRW
jgi:hypothetical protein